ncbi:gluconate transporter [Neobacillus bataviensis LMG 21833]|uniref:Gluconate transporter n=1 Tax=Neobacillus bataviensis LMG 21833 TaxID=1117379 RepID=K6CKC6_9BACI|nr:gluconate:H+ symporter [Neobacillus bataviensis]EKN71595.1 gluconate transporter [Neobacillus bataviensis LMG 21833]
MPLLYVALAVVLLLVLMIPLKMNGFISLLLTSLFVGFLVGMPLDKIWSSISSGLGGQLGGTAIIVGLGAMIGTLMADAGAAQRIATRLMDKLGIKRVQVAILIASLILGVTMFYEVAFVLIIPLVFVIVRQTKLNLLYVALPMSIALSTAHSFLPPHPGPAAVAGVFQANMSLTLLYGLIIAIPAAAFIGLTWTRVPFFKKINPAIPEGLVTNKTFTEEEMPGFGVSIFVAIVPVLLMAIDAVCTLFLPKENGFRHIMDFIGSSNMALLIALLLAMWLLGPRVGRPLKDVMQSCSNAVKPMAMIILVIGAGGAFKQVLVDGGIADYIKDMTGGWSISPIILAWLIAALLRIALGSATVAVMTAAGVVLPIAQASGISMELMTLAVTCGSIAFSHVTDPGFWMFKEYLNLSVGEAIKIRTTYTTALGLIGLAGVLILNLFF